MDRSRGSADGEDPYALRDIDRLIRAAGRHGEAVGIYTERLLAVDLPWTRMRQVYRLLGLARRYGDQPVNTACDRALELDVVSVTKIARMLENATENTRVLPPARAATGTSRFARDPSEFNPRPVQLPLPEATSGTEDQR